MIEKADFVAQCLKSMIVLKDGPGHEHLNYQRIVDLIAR